MAVQREVAGKTLTDSLAETSSCAIDPAHDVTHRGDSKLASAALPTSVPAREQLDEVSSQLHSSQETQENAMPDPPAAADSSVYPDTFAASLAALDQQARRLRAMQAAELQAAGQLPVPPAAAPATAAGVGGAGRQARVAAESSDNSASDAEGSSGSPRNSAHQQQLQNYNVAQPAMPGMGQHAVPQQDTDESAHGNRKRTAELPPNTVLDEQGNPCELSPKEFRRLRRRITNRESAHRMRAKRQEELDSVQREANALGEENGQLRAYVQRLEREQRSLAMDLVSWQTRWKTTAASNVKLYHQLIQLQQQRKPQAQYANLPSHPAAINRIANAPSAPAAVLQHMSQVHPNEGPSATLTRSASEGSSMQPSQMDAADMHHAAGYNFEARAPGYADQLSTALSTIFGARDAALEPAVDAGLTANDLPSPASNLSGVRRWC